MAIKLAIIYYSATGTNYQLASWAQEAAQEAGAEVRLRKATELAPPAAIAKNPQWEANYKKTADIPDAATADVEWADAILFSAPARFGGIASQLKQFLDLNGGLWAQGKLQDKAVSAMASASSSHGGQEAAILQLYTSMYHWGAIVVAPGYTDPVTFAAGGNPYGTSVTLAEEGIVNPAEAKAAVFHQTKRLLAVAAKLAGQAPEAPSPEEPAASGQKYVCTVCGHVYDPALGSPEQEIAPGTVWEDVPEDFRCPSCRAARKKFRKLD